MLHMLRLQKLKVLQVSNNALVSLPVTGDNCAIIVKLFYRPLHLLNHYITTRLHLLL